METQTFTGLMIDPAIVMDSDNVRYKLKKTRIETLAASILEAGEVRQPVEVIELPEPIDGKQYQLITGGYRKAALEKCNAEGAGLLLPARVISSEEAQARLKRQISENVDREDMTPMDAAVAIDKLFKAGETRLEIRKAFTRNTGKKNVPQPASNAWVNIVHSFLDFPAAIRTKIHEGTIGVKAAYELRKQPADKWDTILEKVEANREAEIETENKDEQKFLDSEAKSEAQKAKEKEAADAIEAARVAAEAAAKLVQDARDAAKDAYVNKQNHATAETDVKLAAEKAFKEREKAAQEAEKAALEAKKALDKLNQKAEDAKKNAEDRAEKLRQAREAAATRQVTPSEVVRAGNQVADTNGKVALKAPDMRKAIKDMQLPGSPAKVVAISLLIMACFDSDITDKEMFTALQYVTGDATPKTDRQKELYAITGLGKAAKAKK